MNLARGAGGWGGTLALDLLLLEDRFGLSALLSLLLERDRDLALSEGLTQATGRFR